MIITSLAVAILDIAFPRFLFVLEEVSCVSAVLSQESMQGGVRPDDWLVILVAFSQKMLFACLGRTSYETHCWRHRCGHVAKPGD